MNVNFSKNISLGAPEQLKSQRNLMVEAVLLVVVCALFFWFIILPKQTAVAAKQSNLDKLKDTQKQMDGKLAELQNMVKNLQSNPDDIAKLDQALPLEGKSIRLESLLTQLADQVGVTVGNVSVAAGPNVVVAGNKTLLANPYGAVRALMEQGASVYVIGTFNQIEAFLKKIETSGRIMDITDLEIDGGANGLLNLKVDLNAYYLGAQ